MADPRANFQVLFSLLREQNFCYFPRFVQKPEDQAREKIDALLEQCGWSAQIEAIRNIQAKNVFFRVFASAIGEIFVFSDDFKTAFLQHSYRPDVVRCCPGENRPIYNKMEHPIERLSR